MRQTCHGSGVQVMMRPLGPGMMQQIQQPCSRCNQTGYATPPHDTCGDCQGKVRVATTFWRQMPVWKTMKSHAFVPRGRTNLVPLACASPRAVPLEDFI